MIATRWMSRAVPAECPGVAPPEPIPGAAPVKDANPPEADSGKAPVEVPKIGSRDAPGG